MSSASQLLYGSIQGISGNTEGVTFPDLSEEILKDSPTFYWQMYEGPAGGGVGEPDASGNGFNANLATYTKVSRIRGGQATGAAYLPRGSAENIRRDSSLSLDIPPIATTKNWSYEIIFRSPVPSDLDNFGAIFGEIYDSTNYYWTGGMYIDYVDSPTDPQLMGITKLTNNVSYYTLGPLLENEKSYHVVLKRDNSLLELYVNGALFFSRDDLPDLFSYTRSDNNPVVGCQTLFTLAQSTITVSDAAAYTHALSAERIKTHYDSAFLL